MPRRNLRWRFLRGPQARALALAAVVLAAAVASACSSDAPTTPTSASPQASPAATSVTLTISTQPQTQTVAPGNRATLGVAAAGNGTLHFQWYAGSSGATAAPISNEVSDHFTTPALTASTSYWVRVSDAVASADSTTATITVTPSAAAPSPAPSAVAPTITTPPENQSMLSGHTALLSVQVSGSAPLAYQWYQGAAGNTTSPVAGATTSVLTISPVTATTSYWVRVSNTAGSVDSDTATITITQAAVPTPTTTPTPTPTSTPTPTPGIAPAVVSQPQSATLTSGQSATLFVTASGTAPLAYQWYAGPSGTTSSPIPGATAASYTTPGLSITTNYWVRVSNGYGAANSTTATLTIAVDPGNPAFEDQVLTLLNQQRATGASCGGVPYPAIGPLTMNAALRSAARLHSQDMAANNYFSHTSLDGTAFDQRIANAGYHSFPMGENIAAGQPTPQSVVDAWMGSAGHCTNIMNGDFHAIGVGYAFGAASTYRYYWTTDFGGS